MDKTQDKRTTFTTLDGQKIKFVPFSWDEHLLSEKGLKDEYRERGDVVDCPQYTVTFANGTQQKFDHDSTSIKQAPPGTPPEEVETIIAEQVAAWEKYQADFARFQAESQAEMTNLVYTESLAHITLPADNAWEAAQRKKHIKIPTDPEEKRLHYINTVLLKYRGDQIDFMATVVGTSMGAVREADLETVKNSFRDQIWGNAGQQLSGRNTALPLENTPFGKVDGQPPSDDDPGQETVVINE